MIIGVFLVGCMTFKTGRPIDTSLISHIERGKTTKTEIIQLFGQPLATQILPEGKTGMVYTYQVTKGGISPSSVKAKMNTLSITLKDDIVLDYVYADKDY